jgi:GTP-binding protein HflX|tara:strand:+ start:2978 stop:4273 length:1296 start_codon:yes stop_codon:yes gene_type:complete
LFDRYKGGEHAVLVHVDFNEPDDCEAVEEFVALVESAGLNKLALLSSKRNQPHPKFFVGTGKADEIAEAVSDLNADVLLVNHSLSPGQARNLEQHVKCKVIDRTGLILDIFAQRARTFEGKLQVELAQLQYMSTRLVRGWTHLERQKGGIGLRGPGETQLETDRRLLRARIQYIKHRLEKVSKQRAQSRRSRQRAEMPTVSLVGYTNAGKSTLFNALTSSEVYAANQLFATLDPTLRQWQLGHFGEVILADTVGFIRHLPHDLVAAFKATLEETTLADLLLHVVDGGDELSEDNIMEVNDVLKQVGAAEIPVLMIYNKVDTVEGMSARIERDEQGLPQRVWVSALNRDGLELVAQAVGELTYGAIVHYTLELPASHGKLRAALYEHQWVTKEDFSEQGDWLIDISLPAQDWERLCNTQPVDMQKLIKEQSR